MPNLFLMAQKYAFSVIEKFTKYFYLKFNENSHSKLTGLMESKIHWIFLYN